MPKLAAKDRRTVGKAEAVTGGFEPLPPGKYIATLGKVEAKMSSTGNPMWNVEFEEIHDLDGDKKPGRQWTNLMLPIATMPEDYAKGEEKWEQYQSLTAGRLKAFFEAFGFDVDSDTDEMLGERCVIQLGISTIQKGPRTGEKTNQVNNVLSIDTVEGASSIGGEKDDDDEF